MGRVGGDLNMHGMHTEKCKNSQRPGYVNYFCICTDAEVKLVRTYRNPLFKQILDEMLELHERKSSDYAQDANVYSNFERCARDAGISVDKVFRVFKSVKLARLDELMDSGKKAKNESIEDTLLDDCVYSVLRLAYWRSHKATGMRTEE
jgi:hypothetical protein